MSSSKQESVRLEKDGKSATVLSPATVTTLKTQGWKVVDVSGSKPDPRPAPAKQAEPSKSKADD